MAKDIDDSTKTLGTFFCFVFIAFIFYTLGSQSSQPSSQVTLLSCGQQCCRQGEATTPEVADQPGAEGETTPQLSKEEKDYVELLKSVKVSESFVLGYLKDAKRSEMRMRQDVENWNEERRLEMKVFREEQLRWLWGSKQNEEKSGWFGVMRRKK